MREAIRERLQTLEERIWARVDAVVHSAARRKARARLSRGTAPRRILVVCTGNICRSPYAAKLLRDRFSSESRPIEVDSAGFIGPDRPADPQGSAIARSRGVDLSDHRSRLVRPDDGSRFDLLVVMTRRHRRKLIEKTDAEAEKIVLLGDFDDADPPDREIADPYGKTDDAFVLAFQQIERSVLGICNSLPDLSR